MCVWCMGKKEKTKPTHKYHEPVVDVDVVDVVEMNDMTHHHTSFNDGHLDHIHPHHHPLVWEDEECYRAEDEDEEGDRDEERGGVNIIIREEHVKHSRWKEGVCV